MDHTVYTQNPWYKAGTINLNHLSVDMSEQRIIYNTIT